MTEQLWREAGQSEVWEGMVWPQPMLPPIPVVKVAAGALLVEDGEDAAVERMVDDEWATTGGRSRGQRREWDDGTVDLWRAEQRLVMVRRLRAAVGEGDR